MSSSLQLFSTWSLRLTLAAAFLSAVLDRFGFWGGPGTSGVAWGGWTHFVAYTGTLNGFLPGSLIEPMAWVATLAEVILAVWLLVGFKLRWAALSSAALLFLFGVAMTVALGIKPPLDYSVYTAASAALALATLAQKLEPK